MFECAICHRNSDEVQVQMCAKANMYLCSKHKNQFYRHGEFTSDIKEPNICEVCGKKGFPKDVMWFGKANMMLCTKHRGQFARLGHFLDRTKRDLNEIIMHEDYAEIIFRSADQKEIIGTTLIDLDDVNKCSQYKWMITEPQGNTQYVKAIINNQNTCLHRFVLGYTGEQFVDHINRNGLDNRKSNLRIVSPSENSVNSKTRSATNEKNIYKKGNNYQVQIIRDYKHVYNATFKSLEEAVHARDGFLQEYNATHNRVA